MRISKTCDETFIVLISPIIASLTSEAFFGSFFFFFFALFTFNAEYEGGIFGHLYDRSHFLIEKGPMFVSFIKYYQNTTTDHVG